MTMHALRVAWEYQWVRLPVYGIYPEQGQYDIDTLDELGREGWEAYAISGYANGMIVHLKRPVPPIEGSP